MLTFYISKINTTNGFAEQFRCIIMHLLFVLYVMVCISHRCKSKSGTVCCTVSLVLNVSCELESSMTSTDTDVFEVLTEVKAVPRLLNPVKDPQHPSMWEADAGNSTTIICT